MTRSINNAYVTPELIVNSYYQGFFPMANERGEIGFYSFEPRGIIPLDDRFTIRRSVRQILKKKSFEVRFDSAPELVLRNCARHGLVPSYELWLSDELIDLYMQLFELGFMHTVEVWTKPEDGGEDFTELSGGLYGIVFGGAFCGESMFSLKPYASQVALVHLVEHLRSKQFGLLDAQMPSDHLKQFGLYESTQADYVKHFHEAAALEVSF
jgi:leucyl/phenylalanyl-tRNA--protein transferase